MSGNRPARNEDWLWTYPRLEELLLAVSLKTIAHYVGVRCQTITNFIVNRSIYELFAEAVRKRGLLVQPFWWDQPMEMDLAQEGGLLPPSQQGRGPVANNVNKDDEL
jgi:hypothetical protein